MALAYNDYEAPRPLLSTYTVYLTGYGAFGVPVDSLTATANATTTNDGGY
jgi:hypothetical protein